MSQAACKAALCSWDEIQLMPAGFFLEYSMRKMIASGPFNDGVGRLSPSPEFDQLISYLSQTQMTLEQQEWVRALMKRLAGID